MVKVQHLLVAAIAAVGAARNSAAQSCIDYNGLLVRAYGDLFSCAVFLGTQELGATRMDRCGAALPQKTEVMVARNPEMAQYETVGDICCESCIPPSPPPNPPPSSPPPPLLPPSLPPSSPPPAAPVVAQSSPPLVIEKSPLPIIDVIIPSPPPPSPPSSSPPPNPPPPVEEGHDDGLTDEQIAGVAIGSVAGVSAIAAVIIVGAKKGWFAGSVGAASQPLNAV